MIIDPDDTKADVQLKLSGLLYEIEGLVLDQQSSPSAQALRQIEERLTWAPLAGNGAALLAVAGIIGNVEFPDCAMSALTPCLSLFAFGIASGVSSAQALGWELMRLSREESETTRAVGLIRHWSQQDVGTKVVRDGLLSAVSAALDQLKKHQGRIRSTKPIVVIGRVLNGLSLAFLGAGLIVLLLGHHMGQIRLQRDASVAGSSALATMPKHLSRPAADATGEPAGNRGCKMDCKTP